MKGVGIGEGPETRAVYPLICNFNRVISLHKCKNIVLDGVISYLDTCFGAAIFSSSADWSMTLNICIITIGQQSYTKNKNKNKHFTLIVNASLMFS